MACSPIQGCATNKNYYCINVVCIQIAPHWGTNQECRINQGNMVELLRDFVIIFIRILPV